MKKKVIKEVKEFLGVLVLAVIISTIITTQLFTFSQVQQRSMFDTLTPEDVLFVEKVSLHFSDPKKGDIIVFLNEENVDNSFFGKIKRLYSDMIDKVNKNPNDNRLVKRVIGLAGDEIDIKNGEVYVNGKKIDEPYLHAKTQTKIDGVTFPYIVPEGDFFAMGDNRPSSKDCRDFGAVSLDNVEGIVKFRLFPLGEFGKIEE